MSYYHCNEHNVENCTTCAYNKGYQAGLAEGEARGRRAERADVVAWLRAYNGEVPSNGFVHGARLSAAVNIEAGRHINAAKTDEVTDGR